MRDRKPIEASLVDHYLTQRLIIASSLVGSWLKHKGGFSVFLNGTIGASEMEQWEYLSLFIAADIASHEKELQQRFPNEQIFKFTPRALIPQLNEYGKEGWELVVCHPYTIGDNADVLTHTVTGAQTWAGRQFTHMYLCVFKRRKQ